MPCSSIVMMASTALLSIASNRELFAECDAVTWKRDLDFCGRLGRIINRVDAWTKPRGSANVNQTDCRCNLPPIKDQRIDGETHVCDGRCHKRFPKEVTSASRLLPAILVPLVRSRETGRNTPLTLPPVCENERAKPHSAQSLRAGRAPITRRHPAP